MILPPALRPGDRVALVAPAGVVDESKIETAIRRCEALGLVPVPGAAIRNRRAYLAGTDLQRAQDLRTAIDGDAAAIWAIRGGYGTMRLLRHVDIARLAERPKAYIGFSDNTFLHLALLRAGVVSFHGPHAGFQHFPPATESAFRSVLMQTAAAGRLPSAGTPLVLRDGVAEGVLVGGNLALLAAACGTPYQPDTRGAILFIEDVAEPLYRVDRMIQQLRLAGLLDAIAGLAFGDFVGMPEPVRRGAGEPGGCLEDLAGDLAADLGVPAVLGLPVGHGTENWTLPQGITARLQATREDPGLTILEPAVR